MLSRPDIEPLVRLSGAMPSCRTLPPGLKSLLLQLVAVVFWLVLAAPLLRASGLFQPPWQHALGAGAFAALLGLAWRLPVWWLPINFLFIPGLLMMLALDLASHWYLAAFALLLLVYGGVARSQVPLYLSSRKAWHAVAALVPARAAVVDLGSGLGGMLAFLSRQQPEGRYVGVETAPLPFLLGCLRACIGGGHYAIRWNSLWKLDLRPFDVAYAYLSPVPMAALWLKVQAEMRPGTLFISNTFAVPGVAPSEVVQLDDLHHSRLYLYRL
ncbi:MAG: class I SAM-dependent methyltransferase [Sulfurimicrobium sp.]